MDTARILFPMYVFVLMATQAVSLGAEGDVSPEEAIQRFNSTINGLPNVFAIKANTRFLIKSKSGSTTKQSVDISYYRDASKCVDIEQHGYNSPGVDGADGTSVATPYYRRSMVDLKNRAIVYNKSDAQDSSRQQVVLWSDGQTRFDRICDDIGIGRSLEGYVAHDRMCLSRLLTGSSILDHKGTERINGIDCYALEATVPGHGVYTLWLDPQKNYMARKIAVTKKADDDFGGSRISDMRLSQGSLNEITYTMDSVEFADINGVLLPSACKTSLVWKYASGGTSEWHGEHRRMSVDLHPDFKVLHVFEPNIPDGTAVNYQDFVGTGIQFEWRNGDVTHRMDDTYIQMLDTAAEELKAVSTVPEDQETTVPTQAEKHSSLDGVPLKREGSASGDTVAIGDKAFSFGKALCVLLVVLAIVIGSILAKRHIQGTKG